MAVIFLSQRIGYNWQFYRIKEFLYTYENGRLVLGPIVKGLGITLKISAVSLVFALLFGFFTAILRMTESFSGNFIARGYILIIRNTPLIIQLFFVYFVIAPPFGINAFYSGVIALSLFEGAYISEIIRGSILSVGKEQFESSMSLGMNFYQRMRYIILPQALRMAAPPLTSQMIALVKDSALVSTISIYDMTMQAQRLVSETYLVFEIWFTVAGIYLLINLMLSMLVKFVNMKVYE